MSIEKLKLVAEQIINRKTIVKSEETTKQAMGYDLGFVITSSLLRKKTWGNTTSWLCQFGTF